MSRALRSSDTPLLRAAMIGLLLVALAWQGFLLQTHRHTPSSQVTAGVQGDDGSKSIPLPGDHRSACLTCVALAHAAPAVASPHVEVAAPLRAPFFLAEVPLTIFLIGQRPVRPWQSRAPPITLQA